MDEGKVEEGWLQGKGRPVLLTVAESSSVCPSWDLHLYTITELFSLLFFLIKAAWVYVYLEQGRAPVPFWPFELLVMKKLFLLLQLAATNSD